MQSDHMVAEKKASVDTQMDVLPAVEVVAAAVVSNPVYCSILYHPPARFSPS